ncbi:hypothetical protein ACWGCW_40880 [Streptomyces sp. NPDC054933]
MTSAPGQQDLAVFLTELHGFFEGSEPDVDAALARHFGEDTAVDWIVANVELFIERLTGRPFISSTRTPPGATT